MLSKTWSCTDASIDPHSSIEFLCSCNIICNQMWGPGLAETFPGFGVRAGWFGVSLTWCEMIAPPVKSEAHALFSELMTCTCGSQAL